MKEVNYFWFIIMLAIGLLSHISRTMRWQMLLESDGSKTRFLNTLLAVMNGYFANLALPRLGEVTRCAIVSKYDKQNFSKVLGTMVSERLVDILMLLILTVLAFILQTSEINEFITKNPNLGQKLDFVFSWPVIVLAICLGAAGLFLVIYIAKGKLDKYKLFKKLSDFIKSFWLGLVSLKNVKHPLLFIFHSVFIWSMYFLMLYVCFFAFEGFGELGILAALTLFVAGSFGMVAPAPNGIGAYHFMIINTLVIYGISEPRAASFALIVHGFQTVVLVVCGIASFIIVPLINRNDKIL